jgi:hypothetical protein
MGLERLGKF